MKSIELVKFAYGLLDTKKATDIAVLDIRKLSSLGDYFVVASGTSTIHVKALAGELENKLSEQGIEPRRIEGEKSAVWILLDYNDVIIHIFNHETRDFYCLERLWGDAPRLEEKDIKQ